MKVPAILCAPCGSYLNSPSKIMFTKNFVLLRTLPTNSGTLSYIDYQGLRMRITPTGKLEIIELENNRTVFLWGGNTNKVCNSNPATTCYFQYQSDGNLLLKYNSDKTNYGTGTLNSKFMVFHSSPPYLTVVDGDCATVWPTATNKPSVGPLPRLSPVLNTTNIVVTNKKALAANTWRNQLGINTHISQGWNAERTYNQVMYVGASSIRDGHMPASAGSWVEKFKLAKVSINTVVSGSTLKNITGVQNLVARMSTFQQAYPGAIGSIEGFNEIMGDVFKFTYNGVDPSVSFAGMFQAQKDLYATIKSDPILKNIPVRDFTYACALDGAELGCKNFTNRADYGSIHMYPFNGDPSVGIAGANNRYTWELNTYYNWDEASKYAITETGYHTSTFLHGVTERTQGIYLVNTVLGAIEYGFSKTYLYALYEDDWPERDDQEEHFGVFRNNKTAKPAAIAIHFMSWLLNDTTSSFTPSSISYTLNGVPVGSKSLLFQKSDLTLMLVVWTPAPVYNYQTQKDIINTKVQATLELSWKTTAKLWDVYAYTNEDTLAPVTTLQQVSSIPFSIADSAVIISFSPPSNSSSASTSSSSSSKTTTTTTKTSTTTTTAKQTTTTTTTAKTTTTTKATATTGPQTAPNQEQTDNLEIGVSCASIVSVAWILILSFFALA